MELPTENPIPPLLMPLAPLMLDDVPTGDGLMNIDDEGAVVLGPGMEDHLGLRQAVRESVRQPGTPFPWPFSGPHASQEASQLPARPRVPCKPGLVEKEQDNKPGSASRGPSQVHARPPAERSYNRTEGDTPEAKRQHVEPEVYKREKGETPEAKRQRPPSEPQPQPDPASPAPTIDDGSPDSRATIDYGSPTGGAASSSQPWNLGDFEGREVVRDPAPQTRRASSSNQPLNLNDFEGRELDDGDDTDTASDDPVSNHKLPDEDAKKFAVWDYELRLAAIEEYEESKIYKTEPKCGSLSASALEPLTTGKLPRDLTSEEKLKYPEHINKSKLKEIKGLYDLGCFERRRRDQCTNIIDARWVATWKLVEGILDIKCRLTVRGFKDRMQELETYASTTSRSGQRIVNLIAAQHDYFVLFSFDVSQAFAKGMAISELFALTGNELRELQFEIPAADVQLLRSIPGFEDFDAKTEVLNMAEPIYGLKDAPRTWRKKLHIVLIDRMSSRQLYAEPELYCAHEQMWRSNSAPPINAIERAKEHNMEQADAPVVRTLLETKQRKLLCITSVHVDDFKGTATQKTAESLLQHLESRVGKCKAEFKSFAHTGIQHEHERGVVYTHQLPYIESIKPIDKKLFEGKPEDEMVTCEKLHEAFRSCLGSIAWTGLSRADVAVYIQALQRRGAAPRIKDCQRANLVIRYLRRHQSGLRTLKVTNPLRLVGFTNAAFKALVDEPTGNALRGLAATTMEDHNLDRPQIQDWSREPHRLHSSQTATCGSQHLCCRA